MARQELPADQSRNGCAVAILSFALESNAFNPIPRELAAFQRLELQSYAASARHGSFVGRLRARRPELFRGVDAEFLCLFRGFTGGLIPAKDFQVMLSTAAAHLQKLCLQRPVAGIFLDLHGAMGVEERGASGDAEAELCEMARQTVGPSALISASFDPHGNISDRLLKCLDIVAAYKTVPHVDTEETKEKGLELLLSSLQAALPRPRLVFVKLPLVLSGDTVLSTEGAGERLFQELLASQDRLGGGLLDASLFVGHQYADEGRLGATVVLTCRPELLDAACAEAQRLARRMWELRRAFDFPKGGQLCSWDDVETQLQDLNHQGTAEVHNDGRCGGPLLVGDFGDNLSAGATGDVPFCLRKFLGMDWIGLPVLLAGLADPPAVRSCVAAGVGSTLPSLRVGAALTAAVGCSPEVYGEESAPVELQDVLVRSIITKQRASGMGCCSWAVIEVGKIRVVLQEEAWAIFSLRDLPPEIDVSSFAVIVVKAGINIEALAAEVGAHRCLLANTPGATTEPPAQRRHLPRGGALYPMVDIHWEAPKGTVVE